MEVRGQFHVQTALPSKGKGRTRDKKFSNIKQLIEIGRRYGMEMNVEKNKSNENFKTPIPSNNYNRPKTTGECEMF